MFKNIITKWPLCLLVIVALQSQAQYTYPLESAKRSFDIELGGGSPVLSLQYKRYYYFNAKSFLTPYLGLGTIFGNFRLSYNTGFLFYRRLPKLTKNPCKPQPIDINKVWYWHAGAGMAYVSKQQMLNNEDIKMPFCQLGIGYFVGRPTGSYMLKLSVTPIYFEPIKTIAPWIGVSLSLLDRYKD